MMSPGFVDWGFSGIASNPVEVVLQRVERAVPVAGQRGQELLRHLHRGGPELVPHPAPFPRFGTVRSMRSGNPMKASAI